MDEFIIGLSGTLEVNETVNAIKAKLPDVAKKINSGNDNSLLFVGKLDESTTITQLRNQLNEISKKLTFEIKSDGLQNVISSLKEVSKVLAQTANSANSNSIVNGINAETKAVESLTSAYGKLAKTSQTTKNGIESSFTTTWRNGAITTTETLTPSGTDSEIKNKTKTVVENFEAQQKAINNAELAADKYRQTLATLSDSVVRSTSKDYLSSQEHQTKVLEDITKAQFEIDRLAQTTDKDAFARQKLAVDETISSIRTYISEMQKVEAQTRNAESAAAKYASQLERAQQKAIGESANKRITDPEQIAALAAQYDRVTQAITTMQNSTAEGFQSAKTNVETMLQRYRDMSEEFKRLNTLALQFRDRPVSVIKEQQLAELDALNTKLIRLGMSGDTSLQGISSQFATVNEAITTMRTRLEGIGDTDRQGMTQWLDDFGTLNRQIQELTEQDRLQRFTQNAYNAFLMLNEQIEKTAQAIGSSKFSNNPELERFRNEIETIRAEYTALLDNLAQNTNNGRDTEAVQRFAEQIASGTTDIRNQLKQTEAEFKNFEATARSALNTDNLDLEKQTLSNNITNWLRQNTAAAESTQKAMRNLRAQIEGADKATLNNLKEQFSALKSEAQATGNVGKSFFDQLKSNITKFTGWYSIGNAIASIRREIVGAVSELKEMDTLLTEISKTSDRTEIELQELGQSAYSAASNYGRTVQDYLSGVLEMSRAGYSNAEAMAELSLKAQSAGDMTAELANQYLIATDAAYQLHGSEEQLSNILDGMNIVTNRNAVNLTQLAEATKIAASQSASAGVSVEQMTAAIGTMIATTQQSGEQNARAWRSILMNLRQTAGEIDATTGEVVNADDLTKYEKAVNALGVSLKTVEDGAIKLRDPIEILRELSEAYNQLEEDDTRRANLLASIGGKYRSNALDALLKNFDTYDKMLQDFSEGTGSAAEEAEKTANSWEGSLNKFKNSVTDLTNNFVTSGAAKSFIDFFTGLVKGIDKVTSAFGGLGTAVGLFSALMISKSKSLHFYYDEDARSIQFGASALRNLTGATIGQRAATLGLTVATKALNIAISAGTALIVGGIISAISSWINKDEELAQKQQENIQKLEETNQKYKEQTKTLEDNITEYKKIAEQDKLSESDKERLLKIQNDIIDTYGTQADGIDLVNGKLREQLGLLEQIADTDYQKALSSAISLIKETGEAAEQESTDNIVSFTQRNYGYELRVDDEQQETNTSLDTTDQKYQNAKESAKQYLEILEEIDGFIKHSEWVDDDETQIIALDDSMSNAEKIDAITEALHRLNTETTAEQKDTEVYKALTTKLQGLLDIYEDYGQKIKENAGTLVKGLTASDIGTNVNWHNVTDDTFKEWYDAIISYYSTDRFGKEYQDAVIDWFDRNYTSIAQRMARGTTIAEIAYESEQAFKTAMQNSANEVYEFNYTGYAEDISAVTKEFETLQSVIDKIDKGTYTTMKDGFGLLSTHPELLMYINDTDTLRQKLVELQQSAPKDLIDDLKSLREKILKIGDKEQLGQIDALILALSNLGATAGESLESLTTDDYLKIQTEGISKIIDRLNDEKDAINETIDSLNSRKTEIQDYYDTQINALKEENEERDRNIELQEKQKALDDAKRNKVIVYSAVRGRTIQEDSAAVAKAQQGLDDAISDQQIDQLEKRKDTEVSAVDEQIQAQKDLITSKENEIKMWKEYSTFIKDSTTEITNTNAAYLEAQQQFVLDENSTFTDRINNLRNYIHQIQEITNGVVEDNGLVAVDPTIPFNGAEMLRTQPLSDLLGFSYSDMLSGKNGFGLDRPTIEGGNNTSVFSPNTTFNITANKVDDEAIENWIERYINSQYSKYLVQ